jgi:hypothetical protein
VDGFVASQVARGFSRTTIDNGTGVLERFLALAAKPAWELTTSDVDAVVAALIEPVSRRSPGGTTPARSSNSLPSCKRDTRPRSSPGLECGSRIRWVSSTPAGRPNYRLIRNADDLVVLVHGTRSDAEAIR